jgi:hypothetical protein
VLGFGAGEVAEMVETTSPRSTACYAARAAFVARLPAAGREPRAAPEPVRRGAPLRLVPTRANGQPAFGCYFPSPQTEIARPSGLLVLTLKGDQTSAMTRFAESSVFPLFGLPRMLR